MLGAEPQAGAGRSPRQCACAAKARVSLPRVQRQGTVEKVIHPQVASPTKRGAELPAHTSGKPHSICCGMSNKDEEINKQGGIQSSSGTWGHCRVSWCEDWSPRIKPVSVSIRSEHSTTREYHYRTSADPLTCPRVS